MIKIYDPIAYECIDGISKFESLIFTERFYSIGSFELHLQERILKVNDIIQYKDHFGIVMKIVDNFKGVTVYGYDLKGITDFRVIKTAVNTLDYAENFIKNLVTDCFSNGREIYNFSVEESQGRGIRVEYDTKNNKLSKCIEDISKIAELGWNIEFDIINKTLIFKVLEGNHLEGSVIFSKAFRNIDDIEHTKDNYDLINTVFAEDDNGSVTEQGSESGILRREGYCKLSDVEKTLSEHKAVETLKGQISAVKSVDWQLGDYVTVVYNGLKTAKQITEINYIYENTKTDIQPIFGTEKENIIKKILRGD